MRKTLLTLVGLIGVLASPMQGQWFGYEVAIQDGKVLVAEPAPVDRQSAMYVFERLDGTWQVTDTFQPSARPDAGFMEMFGAGLRWGVSTDVDERNLVVGAPGYEEGAGAVWVYRAVGDSWELDTLLQPEAAGAARGFGITALLYENLLFIGAPYDGEQAAGAVWVYERGVDGNFLERAVLLPQAPVAAGERLGMGLAFDGERLLVAAHAGFDARGAAYVFRSTVTGEWIQEARLALTQEESQPRDAGARGTPMRGGGLSVGWFRGSALLGLPGRTGGRGEVLAFARNPRTAAWERRADLASFEQGPGSGFGHLIASVDNELWISAPGERNGGSVYRFSYDEDVQAFSGATRLSGTIDPDRWDRLGFSLAVEGDLAVLGAPMDDAEFGAALVLRRQGDDWIAEDKLVVPSTPGPPAMVGGEVPCTAEGTAGGFACSRVDVLSFLPTEAIGGGRGVLVNDVWGWTDPQTGREYALIGRSDGTAFVDVSDPTAPVYLGELRQTATAPPSVWRDIKAYENYAIVVADGVIDHGMQIFDLTRLRNVSSPPESFEPDALYTGIAGAHNVVVDEASATAFAVGSDQCGGGLHMIDIREPLDPTFTGCFFDQAGGYSHDAMCVTYDGPDARYTGREICFGSNETILSIADVTDKENPMSLAAATYPNVSYAHQGWLSEDQRYFYMNDEGDEMDATSTATPPMAGTRTLIWDVAELDDPIVVGEYFGPTPSSDHNLYVRGDLLYESNYTSGLRVLSIEDPESPVEVGFFDTFPENDEPGFTGSWSNYPFFQSRTIVVTSMSEGVFFVRYRPPEVF